MSPRIKILMVAITSACMIVSLLQPCDTTVLSLVATLCPSATWVFTTQANSIDRVRNITFFVCFASFLALMCIVLGLTTTVTQNENDVFYKLVFNSGIAGFAGKTCPYEPIAFGIGGAIIVMMVAEICTSIDVEKREFYEELPIARRISLEVRKYK